MVSKVHQVFHKNAYFIGNYMLKSAYANTGYKSYWRPPIHKHSWRGAVGLTSSSSSSFIKPPATGHHRWSGAKKTFFKYFFLQEKKDTNIQLQLGLRKIDQLLLKTNLTNRNKKLGTKLLTEGFSYF